MTDPRFHISALSPASGTANQFVAINATGTALEFVAPPSGGSGGGGGFTQSYAGAQGPGANKAGMVNNRVYLKRITLAAAGLLADVEAYIDTSAKPGNIDSMAAGLWTDASGQPGLLLNANIDPAGSAYTPNGARWYGRPIGRWLTAGSYWIGVTVLNDSSIGSTLYYDTGGGDLYYTSAGSLADGYSSATGAGYANTTTTNSWSLRANVLS